MVKGEGGGSVGLAVVLGALQLNLQPLHADLEAVHGLDGSLRGHRVVVADEACRRKRREACYALYKVVVLYWVQR